MDEAELKRILEYDIEALKANIKRHQDNIDIFKAEIEKDKAAIAKLKRYIQIIELHRSEGEDDGA